MLVVDRFEGGFAIIEKDGRDFIKVSKELLSDGIKEGDYLFEKDGKYFLDKEQTELLRMEISKLKNSLWEK